MTLPVNPTPNIGLSRPNFDVATWHDAINDNFTLLDTLLAAIGVPAVDGTWQNNTAYVIGNRLYDANDASIWICGFAHTSAVSGTFADERVAHPDYWSAVDTGFSVRGAWISGGTTYRTGDVVYDTSEYVVALAVDDHDSTTDIRTDEAAGHWVFIADLKSAVTSATAAAVAAANSASDAAAIAGGDIATIIHGSSEKNPLDDADEIAIWNNVGAVIGKITKVHLFAQIASGLSVAWSTITGTPTTIADYGITDAYTKTEVDSAIATTAANVGKRSRVRVATTANITIATGLVAGQVLDGVTLVTGDLVLVKNQATTSQNGVYVVGATPVRSSEFDTYDEHPGSLIGVEEGTANADTLWLCTSNSGGTLDSTAIAFTKLVIAGELLAGNNLSDVANAATARTNLGAAALASPAFTGTPTAPTQTAGDNSTKLATTAYVDNGSGQTLCGFFPMDNEPPSSNYATFDVRNGHPVLTFPDAVVYAAIFTGIMPKRYKGGDVNVLINWMSDGTSTSTVCFSAQLERMDVGTTDLDADSFGTQVIDTTGVAGSSTSGIQSQTTIALTTGAQMDSVVAGDTFRLKITRETGQANDTLASDVQLVSVYVKET